MSNVKRWQNKDVTLGCGPSAEFSGEFDADDFGALQFPWETGHDVDCVGTTNTDGEHAETTSIGSMRVSSNHETTGAIISSIQMGSDTKHSSRGQFDG
jgi:hypothetical protein